MRGSICKRIAAVVVALCVGVTFIPLAGEYAFAGEPDDTPAVTGSGEAPDEGQTAPEVGGNEQVTPEAEPEPEPVQEPAGGPVVKSVEASEVGTGDETGGDGDEELGWVKVDNNIYYKVDNGRCFTGRHKIDGFVYYFNEEGILQSGWITTKEGKMYGAENGEPGTIGKLVNGWQTLGGKKRYFKAFYMQTGVKTIGGKLYFLKKNDGTLQGKGFFKSDGKEYYCKGNGLLVTGWQALKNKDGKLNGYYFDKKNGVMAKDKTIGYLKIPKNGRLHEAYALGIQKLNKTKWTLRQAYKNSYKIKYQGRWWRQKTAEQYAMKGFKKNKGNCYVMASTFYIQAKLLGYNVRQIKGKVAYRYPHSWTQIKNSKGKWRVYDPNFRNETGRSGWDIYYGKKGTWRYTNYSVFQK